MSAGTSIPAPPSFADFKFNTIGQQPQLLKRFSTPAPGAHYNDRPSPTPSIPADLQYPSRSSSPRITSRPTLLQALADANNSPDVVMSDGANEKAGDSAESHLIFCRDSWSPYTPRSLTSQTLGRNESSSKSAGVSRENPKLQKQSPVVDFPAISTHLTAPTDPLSVLNAPVPPPRSYYKHESPYTALRALQARLLSSLANLTPPDTTNALLLVQSANSHATTALATAHRSHTLAQQALASAREAVTAAQECLSAAEQSKTCANDAATAVKLLNDGESIGGNSEWEWKTTVSGVQDDLRTIGDWVGKMEGEEATKRRQAERVEKEQKNRELVENVMGVSESHGLPPLVVRAMGAEVANLAAAKEAELRCSQSVTPGRQTHQRSAETEADDVRRAWSLEHSHPPQSALTHMESEIPAEMQVDEQASRRHEEEASLRQEQQLREHEEIIAHRMRELEKQKLEVAKFQMLEREKKEQRKAEELSKRESERSRLQTEVDGLLNRQTDKSKAVTEAKRALEAHKAAIEVKKEKNRILEGQRRLEEQERFRVDEAKRLEEAKKEEVRRIIEQKKRQELEDLKKKQVAAEAEARERELLAAQGRRRQEVMAEKHRASAEMAAQINAQRARERSGLKITTSISPDPQTTPIHSPLSQSNVYGNLVAKTALTTRSPSAKPRATSGGVKLGANKQPKTPHSLSPLSLPPQPNSLPLHSPPPSPTLERSAVGIRSKPTKAASPSKPQSKAHRNSIQPADNNSLPLPSTPSVKSSGLPDTSASLTGPDDHERVYAHRRSQDSGNVHVVPASQVPPASPEAQAANLRFVKGANGAAWNSYLQPVLHREIKPEPVAEDDISILKLKSAVSRSSSQLMTERSMARGKMDMEPCSPAISSPITLSNSSPTSALRSNFEDVRLSDSLRSINASRINSPLPAAPNVPTEPLGFSQTWENADTSPYTHQIVANSGQPSATRLNGEDTATTIMIPKPQTLTPNPKNAMTTSVFMNQTSYEDSSQIAPSVRGDGGWDGPPEDEIYSNAFRGHEPAPRPNLRSMNHYSPPRSPLLKRPPPSEDIRPRAPNPSAPASRSPSPPVLGKRRYREDTRSDEPPSRRNWQADNDRARDRARTPPGRSEWQRSPSPDRPGALQSRIGVRDSAVYNIGGGQSYRPTYASDPLQPPRQRPNNYTTAPNAKYTPYPKSPAAFTPQNEHYKQLGRHQVAGGPSVRGRGANLPRGPSRARGGRGGGARPLEQRISSQTPSLMNRLESPPHSHS